MKPLKYFSFIFIFLFLFQSIANAQLKILLGPSLGWTAPTVDYSGETTDYYAGTKYALGSGINFGAMGKLNLGPINFNLSVLYSPLSGSGAADAAYPNSSVEIKQNLFTIGVGTQFGFNVPMSPIKPYIGFDLLFTTISGSTKFQGLTSVPSSTIDLETASRTGLGFAAGMEIKLMSTALDLSIRYNLINLFNKKYDGPSIGNRVDAYKYLNDAKDPNYLTDPSKHPVSTDRTIATIQLQLGVLFGL
jgi:opacity protein-like surface antigen